MAPHANPPFRQYMVLKRVVISIAFSFVFLSAFSQWEIEEVNYSRIPYVKVQEYINHQSDLKVSSFLDIKPSWGSNSDIDSYNKQSKTYRIKASIEDVWNKYRSTSPAISWNGKKVKFGFMFAKKEKKLVYAGQDISQIDTGQVIFLNLKLMGFYNLAVAFEVTMVDQDKHLIEFSYIEGNKSQGKQRLQFIDMPNGNTQIIHSSYFKTGSKFGDKLLYPFFQ